MTGNQGAPETVLTGGIQIKTLVRVLVDKRREKGERGIKCLKASITSIKSWEPVHSVSASLNTRE